MPTEESSDPKENRDPKELAKRMVLYADAITAFAVAQAVPFLLAVLNHNSEHKVSWTGSLSILGYIFDALLIGYLIILTMLDVAEDQLIGKPDKATPVGQWTLTIRKWRWMIVSISLGIIFMSTIWVSVR